MNDVDFPVAEVLAGIEAAREAGLGPIKVNMVVKRGTNEQEILPMARHFKGTGIVLRFIEYMDVGATNGWRMDEVLPSSRGGQAASAPNCRWCQLDPTAPGETAERWGYADASGRHDPQLGEIGVISSVTQAFCGRLQPRAPVHRGQAVPVPVRHPGPRPARACCAATRRDEADRLRHRPHLAGPQRPLFANCAAACRRIPRAARGASR